MDLPFRLRDLSDMWEAGQYRMLVVPGSRARISNFLLDHFENNNYLVNGPLSTGLLLRTGVSPLLIDLVGCIPAILVVFSQQLRRTVNQVKENKEIQ